jgi:hypothetical protein
MYIGRRVAVFGGRWLPGALRPPERAWSLIRQCAPVWSQAASSKRKWVSTPAAVPPPRDGTR